MKHVKDPVKYACWHNASMKGKTHLLSVSSVSWTSIDGKEFSDYLGNFIVGHL